MARLPLTALLLCLCSMVHSQNMIRGEYWIDDDPGFGVATPFDPPLVPSSDILPTEIQVSLAGRSVGFHVFGFRTQDGSLGWSLTNLKTIYVADSSHGEIVEVEYFWDTDPGFGLSLLDTILTDPATEWSDTIVASVPLGLDTAYHLLFMRSRDSRGRWSLTNLVDTVLVDVPTDVASLEAETGIIAFPNPFAEGITVNPAGAGQVRVVIYDPKGQLVYDRFVNSTTTIDLARHASGAYQAYFWKDLRVIHTVTLLKQ